MNQIIYTEEIRATTCLMKLSPERHVFLFVPNKFYNDADSSLSVSSLKLARYCGVRLGNNFYLNQINNCPRSIINCKVSACSSSELNLRSPPSTILFVSNKGSMEVDTSLHPKHTLTAQLTSVQKSMRILFASNKTYPKISGIS